MDGFPALQYRWDTLVVRVLPWPCPDFTPCVFDLVTGHAGTHTLFVVPFRDLCPRQRSRYCPRCMFFNPTRVPRRSQRHWVTIPVRIYAGSLEFDGVTINVSEHGMYVFAATNLSAGIEIEVVFRLPGRKEPVRICGVVRRKALYLYGIEFSIDGTAEVDTAALVRQTADQ